MHTLVGMIQVFCSSVALSMIQLPFVFCHQPATAFKGAYESLGLDASSGKSVNMQKLWHLIQVYFL